MDTAKMSSPKNIVKFITLNKAVNLIRIHISKYNNYK